VLEDVVADTPVGADGIADVVVIDADAEDALDVPVAFVAVTVNVYAVAAVNPLTVIDDALPVPVKPPGELVTV